MTEEEFNIQRARYNLTSAAQHSKHVFTLDLQEKLDSEENNFMQILKYCQQGWEIPFSFSDGNLKDVENSFTLHLSCIASIGCFQILSYSIKYKFKRTPWIINENHDSIFVDFARIEFVNKLDDKNSPSSVYFVLNKLEQGYRIGSSGKDCKFWNRNYTEIQVTVIVTKRPEGSIENLNQITTYTSLLPTKAANGAFSKYFLNEALSDFKVVAGEKIFPAHRFVLAEITQFCELMFSTDMVENQKKEWKIDDFDVDVVQEFLEFAYKGTSKNLVSPSNTDILKELFKMGHMYDIVTLRIKSEYLLKSLINVENVVNLYHLGFLYESRSLMAAAKMHFNRYKGQILPDGAALRQLQKDYPPDIVHELIVN